MRPSPKPSFRERDSGTFGYAQGAATPRRLRKRVGGAPDRPALTPPTAGRLDGRPGRHRSIPGGRAEAVPHTSGAPDLRLHLLRAASFSDAASGVRMQDLARGIS